MNSLHLFALPPRGVNSLLLRPNADIGSSSSSALSSTSLLIDAVSAWSVSGETLTSNDTAASLFGASLFPYLALLFFLSRPETKTPAGANFGFRFLLAFVFATIPAGIYAKLQYHDILANVDWLHGTAESLLTITNLFIIFGFRDTREKPVKENIDSSSVALKAGALVTTASLLMAGSGGGALSFLHPEPANALSIPTWIVHVSSLLEWLVAMKLIFEHAQTSDNPRWKGLTWGMVPSHASGLCACTYHLFYNSFALSWLVVLQSFLTVLGNSTMAFAAYRIYAYEKERTGETSITTAAPPTPAPVAAVLPESDNQFVLDMFIKSLVFAAVVKYGELTFDFPFATSPDPLLAAGFIGLPTLGNIVKWKIRSDEEDANQKLA